MVNREWKRWWVVNAWAPTGLVKKKFHIDNKADDFLRRNRCFNKEYNRLKLREEMNPKDRSESIKAMWKYFIDQEININLKDLDAPDKLRKLTLKDLEKRGYDRLRSHISKIDCYKTWMNEHSSMISFLIFHVYPGENYCKEYALFPEQFLYSKTGKINLQRMAYVVSEIYLRDEYRKGKYTKEKLKEQFVTLKYDPDILSRKNLLDYGINDRDISRLGIDEIRSAVAKIFDPETSSMENDLNWNSNRFKNENPDVNYDVCLYCGREPTDLHHLIPRKEDSNLMYHNENVIGLCVQVHEFIHRKLKGDFKKEYDLAKLEWKREPSKRKFDSIMKKIHGKVWQNSPQQ